MHPSRNNRSPKLVRGDVSIEITQWACVCVCGGEWLLPTQGHNRWEEDNWHWGGPLQFHNHQFFTSVLIQGLAEVQPKQGRLQNSLDYISNIEFVSHSYVPQVDVSHRLSWDYMPGYLQVLPCMVGYSGSFLQWFLNDDSLFNCNVNLWSILYQLYVYQVYVC